MSEANPKTPSEKTVTSVEVSPLVTFEHVRQEGQEIFQLNLNRREDGVCPWDEFTDDAENPESASVYLKPDTAVALAIEMLLAAGLRCDLVHGGVFVQGVSNDLIDAYLKSPRTRKVECGAV